MINVDSFPCSHPLVSIIIVTYNSGGYLGNCVNSIRGQSYSNIEIIIIDNASTDSTPAIVSTLGSDIKYVSTGSNTGYARGNNLGVGLANGKYVMTLNPDTYLDEKCVENLVQQGEREPAVGILAPLQKFMDHPDVIEAAGCGVKRDGRGCSLGRNQKDSGQYDHPVSILSAPGASAAFRRDAFTAVGGFDEDFFGYGDEQDIAWRCRALGWQGRLVPSAIVLHKGGASISVHPNGFAMWYFYQERNRLMFLIKCFPLSLLLGNMYYLVRYEAITFVRSVRTRNPWPYRARLAVLKLLPSLLRKRTAFFMTAQVSHEEMRKWLT